MKFASFPQIKQEVQWTLPGNRYETGSNLRDIPMSCHILYAVPKCNDMQHHFVHNYFFLSVTEINALNKQAWQMYPRNGWDGWGDQKVVDGLKSYLDDLRGECTISADVKLTAGWGVDQGNILSIHHILMQYRTDNHRWGMFSDGIYSSKV